ncbi:MAG: hypothetical protein PHU27_11995, partial [Salinivirgaceae bacterium]|nr:hypothetical protein [Salinivirgaceae bacterium]
KIMATAVINTIMTANDVSKIRLLVFICLFLYYYLSVSMLNSFTIPKNLGTVSFSGLHLKLLLLLLLFNQLGGGFTSDFV